MYIIYILYIYIFYGGPSPKTYVSNKDSAIYSVLCRFWPLQVLYVYYIHTTQMTLVRDWNPKMKGHPSETKGHWSLRLQTIMGI